MGFSREEFVADWELWRGVVRECRPLSALMGAGALISGMRRLYAGSVLLDL